MKHSIKPCQAHRRPAPPPGSVTAADRLAISRIDSLSSIYILTGMRIRLGHADPPGPFLPLCICGFRGLRLRLQE
jgi:hypothetical protein